MKYRTIGTDPKTRREVSVLSLGAMHFGTATDGVRGSKAITYVILSSAFPDDATAGSGAAGT